MTSEELDRLAERLAREETPDGVELVKRSRVRVAARAGDVFLKVFFKPSGTIKREARALARARRLGLPVPELVGSGRRWIATRFLANARPARREDLMLILPVVEALHDRGMLHRDLHLGNLLVVDGRVVVLDLQRAMFAPKLPRALRNRELGFLGYSLGEPLPDELAHVRKWVRRRAHEHWRSRTRRCLKESSSFAAFEAKGVTGFRRRDADEHALRRALDIGSDGEVIKLGRAGNLYRCDGFMLKQHPSRREARRSWVSGHGLEVRGVPTG